LCMIFCIQSTSLAKIKTVKNLFEMWYTIGRSLHTRLQLEESSHTVMPPQIISADFNVNGGKAGAGLWADVKRYTYKRIYTQVFLAPLGKERLWRQKPFRTQRLAKCSALLIHAKERINQMTALSHDFLHELS